MFLQYWDNSKEWHGKLLFEGTFSSFAEADKIFEEKFSINLVQNSHISCQIHKEQPKNDEKS